MKYFMILCLYVVLVQSKLNPVVISDWNNIQGSYIDVCSKEANLDPKIPPIILKELYTPDEPNFHCYLKCVMKHNNLIQDDNNLDVTNLAELVHLTPEIVSQCVEAAKYETDPCRKAYLVATCCMVTKEVAEDWGKIQSPYLDKCVKESNVDPLIPNKVLTEMIYPDDYEFGCYVKCIFQNLNMLSADNIFNIELLSQDVHMAPEIAKKCVSNVDGITEIRKIADCTCSRQVSLVTSV